MLIIVSVVKKLAKSYNINFGVRSVVHEVQRIAVQQVAEAQIRGVLNKKYVHSVSRMQFIVEISLQLPCVPYDKRAWRRRA